MTDKVPDLEMDAVSDSDSGDDWDEVEDTSKRILCLFCEKELTNSSESLSHLETVHNFNLIAFKTRHTLDIYSYIKLVNFIRKNHVSAEELKALGIKTWDSDEYLTPVLQDDGWLMLDIEDFEDEAPKPAAYPVNSENGCVTLSEVHFAELQRTIQSLKAQLEQRELACLLAKQQIDEMIEKAQHLVLDDDSQPLENRCVRNVSLDVDEGYFSTYSHFAIHHEMLTDKVRTESYRDALLTNSHMFSNCVMLDVGCGTGILSMFAAKSGCRQVISVDQSDVIYHAMDIVRENHLTDVITLKKGRLEDIELDIEKVDAIVSEWMGYFLLFEGMLDTVIYARDNYLRPGGKLLPNRCAISIVGSGDTKRYIDLVDYWSNVYGFKMSCMKPEVVREPSIEICNPQDLVTSVAEIKSFDLYTVQTDCVNFSVNFDLTVHRTGSLTAIIGYFDVFFDLDNPISFSTGPQSTPTHWKQTVFSLSEPISITEGEVVSGKLICRRNIKDIRGLVVTIHIKNFSQVYHLD
ncbi:protein arginine N-methyltransferase 3 [Cephus cinctus]|uniref:type I protein arginine methyltransferase n=1 Tax=Cephus cinctus TaxID=211228 RepID=A0AAJ7C7H1_CEPCN|nr:protein arginine N-methyltransferase 3 [Cephus cinctus]XP_015603829.1 protein arginine N-methyltransferase 3 [Cephus cinctus]